MNNILMKNKYIKLLICFVIINLMFTGCSSKKENNEVTQNESIKIDKEEVTEEDEWGEKSSFDRVSAPRVFELIVTGAKPNSIDRETYTEQNIAEARRAIANKDKVESNFGEKKTEVASNDGWGDDSSFDDEDIPW